MLLYTLGHSNHPSDKFTQLLAAHGIQLVVDVRSTPFSRFNPQFNRANLQANLTEHGIAYTYLGDALGGRPKDPSVYIHHSIPKESKDYWREIDYRVVMRQPWFIQGIHQLLDLAEQQVTTVLCSEEDPARCHRQHLVARYLLDTYPEVTILHIRKDGSTLDARSIVDTTEASGPKQLPLIHT